MPFLLLAPLLAFGAWRVDKAAGSVEHSARDAAASVKRWLVLGGIAGAAWWLSRRP